MDSVEKNIKEAYQQNLTPEEFQKFKLQGLKEEKSENNYDFWFSCLYKFFSSGKWSGSRLLDLGSGPTVHNIATASAFLPHIILSEFVEANCQQLRKWLNKDPESADWTPFFRRVARAEGRSDLDAACSEIESRIRSAVKGVIHCDVLDDNVIAEEYRKVPYDIVLTALTFETAAVNWESYSKILGRVNKLLRVGGKLVMIGVTGCSYWKVGSNKFHCLPMEEEDIERALKLNGFGEIHWTLRDKPDGETPFDCKKVYFVTCTKL
ncbi:indolethylamine N-methyltransferase-like [Uloborus diversus]|uniref:indolethylamine N-methyltransferase-like n=1 Tax=Uloborus diversus TaxID=327109 RepID=UPI0024094DD0|nr:indolethylamine N-methyltransferase-like [Uloborus diversus]